jgi:hypothetical protein
MAPPGDQSPTSAPLAASAAARDSQFLWLEDEKLLSKGAINLVTASGWLAVPMDDGLQRGEFVKRLKSLFTPMA